MDSREIERMQRERKWEENFRVVDECIRQQRERRILELSREGWARKISWCHYESDPKKCWLIYPGVY